MRDMNKEIEFLDDVLVIKQEFSEELGATVWDAALVLIYYWANEKVFDAGHFKGLDVVELGAGTGLCGIALAKLGARVTLTDLPPLLPLLRHNVELNGVGAACDVAPLAWGVDACRELLQRRWQQDDHAPEQQQQQQQQSTPQVLHHPDIIVLSDCISGCYSASFRPLVDTLREMVPLGSSTITYLSYELRDTSPADTPFFEDLRARFGAPHRVSADQFHEVWRCDEIAVFTVRRER